MKDRKVKQVLSRGGYQLGGIRKGGQIWCMYFIFIYGNRIMKFVEIILEKGRENEEE
jgi:hypothetical protein